MTSKKTIPKFQYYMVISHAVSQLTWRAFIRNIGTLFGF